MDLFSIFLGEKFLIKEWFFSLFLGALGFLVFKLLLYKRRSAEDLPFRFSYWWTDNKIELFLGCIFFYLLMRFYEDIVLLLGISIDIPVFNDRYFLVFLCGLFFQIIVKKGRSIFHFRSKYYENGKKRDLYSLIDQPNPKHEEH